MEAGDIKRHTSRVKYLFVYLVILALFAVSIFTFIKKIDVIPLMTSAIALLFLIVFETMIRIETLIITQDSVLHEVGILAKKRTVIHFSSITDITTNQSTMQRIFGTGDVHINTGGTNEAEAVFKSFPRIGKIHEELLARINAHKFATHQAK